jgi:hypothetical protein
MRSRDATRLLYEQRGVPVLQNRVYDSVEDARASPSGDVMLVEDLNTGLVRNAAFDPSIISYDSAYQNEQALSPRFLHHLEQVAGIIIDSMGHQALVEVGCGKGFFLEMLARKGVDVIGFDPAYEGDNPRICREYFRQGVGIEAKGIFLRHVLEHIPDPFTFLDQLREANSGSGIIYIEVPCFGWICERRAWFDVFYEHVNYFRLSDFRRMFGTILSAGHIFGGQYIYVVADLSTLRKPSFDEDDRPSFPKNFAPRLDLSEASETPVVIWGGSSKGVIFSLLGQRAGLSVKAVIDINPAKQGRYLALTGLRVYSPEEALTELEPSAKIYVMNSNYTAEIKDISGNKYNYIEIDHV